jgi:hypothetical protein
MVRGGVHPLPLPRIPLPIGGGAPVNGGSNTKTNYLSKKIFGKIFNLYKLK